MTAQDQYIAYLTGLSDQATKLELKLAALLRLRDHEKAEGFPEQIPLLFTSIAESLHVDVVLSLAKLFEDRSDRNIPRFLNYVEANHKHLKWAGQPITIADLTRQRSLIESNAQTIQNVKAQRDKYFAHHDKKHFGSPESLSDKYPLTKESIIDLVRLLQKLLAEHSVALNGSARVSIAEFAVIHIDKMIRHLCCR